VDPLVLAHYGGDVQRANLAPHARARLLARYPAPAPRAPVRDRLIPPDAAPGRQAGTASATAYGCPGCGYAYEPQRGDPREGFPAGTPWSSLPADWPCPDCGVREKAEFVPLSTIP
jgi:alkane 1-monooxygenase